MSAKESLQKIYPNCYLESWTKNKLLGNHWTIYSDKQLTDGKGKRRKERRLLAMIWDVDLPNGEFNEEQLWQIAWDKAQEQCLKDLIHGSEAY